MPKQRVSASKQWSLIRTNMITECKRPKGPIPPTVSQFLIGLWDLPLPAAPRAPLRGGAQLFSFVSLLQDPVLSPALLRPDRTESGRDGSQLSPGPEKACQYQ